MRTKPSTNPQHPASSPSVSRRALLTGGATGAALGVGATLAATLGSRAFAGDPDPASATPAPFGGEALACHGPHQAGIVSAPAAHARYVAYSLRKATDRAALVRMFRILTGDIEALTQGVAPLADPEPELAERPARLTITVGVGPVLVERVDAGLRPAWLAPLPAFARDQLGAGYDGGDLVVLVQSDDPLALAHACRMLDRDLASFAERAWVQQGFRQARGAEQAGSTMRNLMGQVDGTVNPAPADNDFAQLVWLGDEAGWLAGGSALVLRRIRMELDTWDMVDRPGREQTIGRTLADGAPLTGGTEHTPVDFDAKTAAGLPVIASFAHVRRAHSEDPTERIFRRAVNYDDGTESGLLFGCYQRDPLRQFVPIQQRLDELDLLNEWVTHVGSAVFAMLPGFRPGELLGASLLK
ncbi:dye decolorizing peroxidase [Leucobacter exalbidus]|uniref:Dye decolorizing peroxidase n=1 Tax=Leucobacter exalbidus TaxID=662960 RepID=A0A940Q0Q8_9MICO|nr:Dyp-type peroxidase [Leucobacter exalbidus]MBP1327581.1 dye decolorizing peroxidase [Leucobacter exalbidus]